MRIEPTSPVTPIATSRIARSSRDTWRTYLRRSLPLYVMLLPAALAILIFNYGPLFGVLIAFQDFSPTRGVLGSPWVGFDNFTTAFRNPFFLAALRNSIIISLMRLVLGFPAAIILALLLNEVRVRWFKSLVQTATLLPYFVSWVIIAIIFGSILAPRGIVNEVLQHVFGMTPVLFLSDPDKFRWIIVLKGFGKVQVGVLLLYLAAMSTIDPTLYEAAMVDGANRWEQTWHITIPGIAPTIATLFILNCGYLLSAGFEQVYVMINPSVASTGEILEIFTLRLALRQSDYGLATSIGLFQSVIGIILLVLANFIVKKADQDGLF